MKKVKVTLKAGSTGKKFHLFPDSESLYVWACAVERGEVMHVPDIEELVLEPDGFIEAELMGFEYAYEDNSQKFRRLDFIRLGKAQCPKNSSGMLVTIHSGWVLGTLLPMKEYSDSEIEVKPLTTENAILELHVLFEDCDEEQSDEENVDDNDDSDMIDEDPPPDDDDQ